MKERVLFGLKMGGLMFGYLLANILIIFGLGGVGYWLAGLFSDVELIKVLGASVGFILGICFCPTLHLIFDKLGDDILFEEKT